MNSYSMNCIKLLFKRAKTKTKQNLKSKIFIENCNFARYALGFRNVWSLNYLNIN